AVPVREGVEAGRQRAGQDARRQAGAGDDGGRAARDLRRLVAGVVADDDETAVVALLAQVRGETGGGADHDRAVHPHRTGPELTAETGGAELQGAAEAAGAPGGVPGLDGAGESLAGGRGGGPGRRGPGWAG